MAAAVQNALDGKPVEGVPAVTGQTKLFVLAGHDTNLDALATLYGLDWSFADQPDPTAPNTTLAFELWRTAHGPYIVVRLFHQGWKPYALWPHPLRHWPCRSLPLARPSRPCSLPGRHHTTAHMGGEVPLQTPRSHPISVP